MKIIITNKIEEKVNGYQDLTGATKTWIAKQLGISKSRLYQIMQADNMMIDVAMKFAIFFNCSIEDLFDYSIVADSKELIDNK